MDCKQIARQAVKSSVVLLKNEGGLLPLAPGQNVAVFGWAQWESVLSGNGSGAARGGKAPSILEALKDAGLQPVEELAVWYREEIDAYNRANPRCLIFPR